MALMVRVRFFAVARDWMGTASLDVEVPDGATTEAVWDLLVQREPKLSAWRGRLRLAVNDEYVSAPAVLRSGDAVAVIPPVSGG
jgi:molybdopterin synthase sulfur carrier subunit